MRWTMLFLYLSVVAVVTLFLHSLADWAWWVVLITILLLVPFAFVIGFMTWRAVPWAAVLSYLSAIGLLAAVGAQAAGSFKARTALLLVWSVLMLAVAIGLCMHPMRRPGWGIFIGFWGVVGVVWLIVIQALALADVLTGAAYTGASSWPLALVGIWFVVASINGFGEAPFPTWLDSLGVLVGLGLLAISIATWADLSLVRQVAGLFSAIAYTVWAAGFGWILWELHRPAQRSLAPTPVVRVSEVAPALQIAGRPSAIH